VCLKHVFLKWERKLRKGTVITLGERRKGKDNGPGDGVKQKGVGGRVFFGSKVGPISFVEKKGCGGHES